MDDHQKLRENVAAEYHIALYRRYREKEARGLVGYEASWWKRHRKAGNIPFIADAGGGISYLGYMLCDIIILGKDAVRVPPETNPPVGQSNSPAAGATNEPNGPSVAMNLIRRDP